jgi:hypothetical protein
MSTKPICCPDKNPGGRGRKPLTNRLSYGTAITTDLKSFFYIIPNKIQTFVVPCDEFLYACIVEIWRQSVEPLLIVFFRSSLQMRVSPYTASNFCEQLKIT